MLLESQLFSEKAQTERGDAVRNVCRAARGRMDHRAPCALFGLRREMLTTYQKEKAQIPAKVKNNDETLVQLPTTLIRRRDIMDSNTTITAKCGTASLFHWLAFL